MQKSSEMDDLRVRRTRKMIQEALIELTVEQGFDAVTVRDICERAMINRSTFYRHHIDKHAVLDEYLADVKTSMTEAYTAQMAGEAPDTRPAGLMTFLRHVQKSADFYCVMLGAKGDARFIQHFRHMIENHFRLMIGNQPTDPKAPPLDLRLSYVSGADVAAILWWLENDRQRSVEEIAAWIGQITSSGVRLVPQETEHDRK